ncbi:MAG: 3-deoxy-manno-octulosonate cytidylyltransferase [Hydrogenothermaceae bacterium]|nr:3-deoxy-manno-octulosonate cytidylyltransferase [Hydrogenothermaceae bacterium]
MKTAIVIPARRGSTRLKDKLLLKVKDKPIIAYTVENCLKVKGIDRVIVACDDEEFKKVLKDYPVDIILTPTELQSGSDRVAFAVKNLDFDFVVNVQADEPLLNPEDIHKVAEGLREYPVATLAYPIENEEDYLNPNVVKVVLDRESCGIYFSRSSIPFYRDIDFNTLKNLKYPLKHIGVYGYRKDVLLTFAYSMEKSPIEEIEKLEQLRLLYNGYKIKVFIASKDTVGIDTKEDFEKFCTLI